MTDSTYTALCLLIDCSGSMERIREATQDSINEFVEAQRERTGRTTLRIIQFDAPLEYVVPEEGNNGGWYRVHCPSTPAADVPKFVLQPGGRTALYDAMVRTIDEFGAELAAMDENQRPGTVIIGAVTDGLENASTHTSLDVERRITRQTDDYGWHFVYLGANQDAILEGAKMGIPRASSMTYDADDQGTHAAGESLQAYAAVASAGGQAAFTDEDRKRASKAARRSRKG